MASPHGSGSTWPPSDPPGPGANRRVLLLAAILRANRSVRWVLFDLADMIESAAELLATHGGTDRAIVAGGHILRRRRFQSQAHPPRPGRRPLRAIVHGCRDATLAGGRLFVLEEAF